MSRLRSTIDSVTKAVGGADLISRFSRFKPGGATADGAHAEKALPKVETLTSTDSVSGRMKEKTSGENGEVEETDKQKEQVREKPFVAAKKSSSALASATDTPGINSSTTVAKQTMQLFHPAALSTNMDETYKSLSNHINSYFGPNTQGEDGENRQQQHVSKPLPQVTTQRTADHIPVLSPVSEKIAPESPPSSPLSLKPSPSTEIPSSVTPATENTAQSVPETSTTPKKGFTHYLSYPGPSVQAFVGSYIVPLVPRLRGDQKKLAVEKEKSSTDGLAEHVVDKGVEKTDGEEDKAEKAKQQLLSQREKIIARVSVDNRTRALVKGLQRVSDVELLTTRVGELSFHLLEFPETRGVAVQENLLPCLLRLRQARDLPLQAAVREALALVGYTDPVKGRGIRVLAIDGGGTRGLLALQTLHKLEELTGKRIHQLFDYICGVSTGAILAFMLGIFQIPLEECEDMYRKLGTDIFKQNVIVGTMKMGWSHAFYDSEMWEGILKERMGEGRMIESSRDPCCPKVAAVSTIVNRGLPLKAYVFRNYRLMPGVRSHYLGDCKHKMWQAIRASSAAPGYFQEFVLGKDLHQDGGLLINNPTALAIHECKCLWPNTPLQCVLSLGTGRYETVGKNSVSYTSLKTKLAHVISSATDTEEVHTMLDALLPPDTYFRFNPYMSEDVPLNESRQEKLNLLKGEGERYLERNEAKLKKAASVLGQEKGVIQRLAEWGKLKADMYEGIPFLSKL
ncbi:PREDICTED: calcium-independent phospholipase A2-gamma-like [Cyprinodon variegatus]|uniref:Patatin-like phospholipase domain containing 8 n=1 Tax=Cyprinodon variegatus TaxID=28743 RepID=A0A3Q2CEC9_CYPVA|nr:PREDICTED: calcium-independent phospholipase A2-gamma-like [Cyprinodon variegatus]